MVKIKKQDTVIKQSESQKLPIEGFTSKSILNRVVLISLILTVALVVGILANLKLNSYSFYQYMSDVFMYDQVMQETLRGNFGLEYTYGNQFGEHAYFILLPMLFLKMILRKYMVVFLLLLCPIIYGLVGIVLFIAIRNMTSDFQAFLGTAVYFLNPGIIRAMSEGNYGYHFDTFSGFLITGAVALLMWRWYALEHNQKVSMINLWFWIMYVIFIIIKEEMALLAIILFSIVLLVRRNRFYMICLGTACVVFAIQLIVIKISMTDFNRTDTYLIKTFMQGIHEQGFITIFFSANRTEFWHTIFISIFIFSMLCFGSYLVNLKINILALGLFVTGLAKLSLSFLVKDHRLTSWHNFPGVVMLTGGFILQTVTFYQGKRKFGRILSYGVMIGLLVVSFILFKRREVEAYYYWRNIVQLKKTLGILPERDIALVEIKNKIDPKKVIAINTYTARDWLDGYRFSFFPRGVFWSPRGIANYVVIDLVFPQEEMVQYLKNIGKSEFSVKAINKFFILFERKAVEADSVDSRERFIGAFGQASIGGAIPFRVVRSVNRKGLIPEPSIP